MRRASAVAVALAFAPLPAAADVTARYQLANDELAIEVDDGGDYRAEVPGKFMLMRRAGIEYVVMIQGTTPCVFERRLLIDYIKSELRGELAAMPDARGKAVLTKGGDEVIAGRRGSLWSVGLEKGGANKVEAVMSGDADLAPIGAVFASTVEVGLDAFEEALSGSNFAAQTREMFAKGTPLRLMLMGEMRLKSVSTATIDPTRFVLPGPLLDAAALLAPMPTHAEKIEIAPASPPAP